MTHGSLFSGIGGFELAAEWMGWENKFHCEWNEFGQKVLHHYWPESEQFTDIKKSNFTKYANKIDILTGGFPCQPYSSAGKRLGKEDERHLWPEMLRAIREIQPSWVVGENVRGLTNWNGGMVFDEVQADLETEGYEVLPFLLPACSVNAPHKRDRIWFIAHSKSNGCNKRGERINKWQINKFQNRSELWDKFTTNGKESNATNTNSNKQHRSDSENEINASQGGEYALSNIEQMGSNDATDTCFRGIQGHRRSSKIQQLQTTEFDENNSKKFGRLGWEKFPTQSPICNGNDGIPTKLDGITFSKWRNESIKAGGNAIVPQVALQIFKAIEQYDKTY
jgi:DNA (cytosine-5)-methyltransferase 1